MSARFTNVPSSLGSRSSRLARSLMLAFVVPLWVLPFLPPWPVVFVAFLAATCFTLTARTPEGLRAMVMTSVISINTLAAPLGFLVAGQVLEHWGVVPLFTAVVAGTTRMAIVFAAIVLHHRDVDAEVAGAESAMP